MDRDDDFDVDDLLKEMDESVPEADRLGIFSDTAVDYHPQFAEVAKRIAELMTAVDPYVDDNGAIWQIIAAVIDRDNHRAAWVEWKEREGGRIVETHYFLRARDRAGTLLSWEIETYNPYDGCTVHSLAWCEESAVIVYSDKHDTFVAALGRGHPVTRVEINPEWRVVDDILWYRSDTPDFVGRLQLPLLQEIEPLPAEHARRLGVLPPGYDDANQFHKQLYGPS